MLSFILCNSKEPFLDELWHAMKSGFYMTTGNDQLSDWTGEEAPKHLPKLKLHTQTHTHTHKSQSLFGGLLLVWSSIAFWIPAKLFHLRSIFSKLMGCTENWSCHWSTVWAQSFSTTAIHLPGETGLRGPCGHGGTHWSVSPKRQRAWGEGEWEQGSERKPRKDHAEEELLFHSLRTFPDQGAVSPPLHRWCSPGWPWVLKRPKE